MISFARRLTTVSCAAFDKQNNYVNELLSKSKKSAELGDARSSLATIFFLLAVRHLKTIVLVCSTLAGANAFSEESYPEKTYPTVWLNPGFYSYHFDQEADLRENNIGFGAEMELSRNHVLTAGTFLNSDDDRTRYGGYEWRPLHWHPAKTDVSAGLIIAVLDGYPRVREGDWFVTVLPIVSLQWKRIGFNLTAVPTIKDKLYGAVAIQFKLRIW